MKAFLSKIVALLHNLRFRHGRTAVLMTVFIIAVLVLLNVGITSLEQETGGALDLSFNQYASIGQLTKQVLETLDTDVELYLLYQNGEKDAYLDRLLERYASLSDHVHYMPTDIARNPGILNAYRSGPDEVPGTDSVIVDCPAIGSYRVLDYSDFINQGYNTESGSFEVDGYAYEKQLTQAIAYVTGGERDVIAVLSGHGEYTPEEMQVFIDFVENNGYTVYETNLMAGDMLDEADLLLIASPQKDLGSDETEIIAKWVQQGGSIMVWRDYTDRTDLPNLMLLQRSYGIVPLHGIVVAGEEDVGSYYQERIALLPYMEQLDLTLSLTQNSMDVLLMPGASGYEDPVEGDTSLSLGTVLKAGPNAYVRDFADGYDGIEYQPGDRKGAIPLALYAHRMHANGNVSRMLAVGCGAMFTNDYVYQRTFLEEFILTILSQLIPSHITNMEIAVSAALRPALTVGSQTAAIVIVAVIPLAVIAVGRVVLWRRRRK